MLQRAAARPHGAHRRAVRGIVAEGRDITTVVAPDADVRVLLTASEEARLRRAPRELHGTADAGGGRGDPRPGAAPRPRRLDRVRPFHVAADGVVPSTPPSSTSTRASRPCSTSSPPRRPSDARVTPVRGPPGPWCSPRTAPATVDGAIVLAIGAGGRATFLVLARTFEGVRRPPAALDAARSPSTSAAVDRRALAQALLVVDLGPPVGPRPARRPPGGGPGSTRDRSRSGPRWSPTCTPRRRARHPAADRVRPPAWTDPTAAVGLSAGGLNVTPRRAAIPSPPGGSSRSSGRDASGCPGVTYRW